MPTLAIFKCDSCGCDIPLTVDAVTDTVHTCDDCQKKGKKDKKEPTE